MAGLNVPSYAPGKGWSCQVGGYMLKESFEVPYQEVKSLGYINIYYIDTVANLRIYDLDLKGQFDQATANAKMKALADIGFKPRLEQVLPGPERVLPEPQAPTARALQVPQALV